MATLFPRRPPTDTRLLVVLRAPLDALAARLPEGSAPRPCRGFGVLLVDVALRRDGGTWSPFPGSEAARSRLSWRVPVVRGGESFLWLARGVVAPGAGVPWPRKRTPSDARPHFRVDEQGARLVIDVEVDHRSLFGLVAEPGPGLVGSLFGSVRSASEEFERFGPLDSRRSGERRLVPRGSVLEPLLVHTLEVATPPELGGAGGVPFEVDSAFRVTDLVRRPAGRRLATFARLPHPETPPGLSPAMSAGGRIPS